MTHANFDPKVTRTGVQGTSKLSTAALVTIPGLPAKGPSRSPTRSTSRASTKTSGAILVGFYLPGDADGSGVVNQADLNAIKYAMNTNASDTTGKYSFDADVNRDGMINEQDLTIAKKNLGLGTTVSPVISANVAPSMMVDPTNRITNLSHVTITGAATPDATITYSETGESPVSTTADTSGNYSITIPLLTGVEHLQRLDDRRLQADHHRLDQLDHLQPHCDLAGGNHTNDYNPDNHHVNRPPPRRPQHRRPRRPRRQRPTPPTTTTSTTSPPVTSTTSSTSTATSSVGTSPATR